MKPEDVKDPLVMLYGEDVLVSLTKIVEELRANSNIPFDEEYLRTGVAFMRIKAKEILEGSRKEISLKNLTSESFGEAAIARYNV